MASYYSYKQLIRDEDFSSKFRSTDVQRVTRRGRVSISRKQETMFYNVSSDRTFLFAI